MVNLYSLEKLAEISRGRMLEQAERYRLLHSLTRGQPSSWRRALRLLGTLMVRAGTHLQSRARCPGTPYEVCRDCLAPLG